MEIINWLRGTQIGVITLLRMDTAGMPKEFADKPLFTQWVYSDHDETIKHINGLVEGLATRIAIEEGGAENVDVEQNDDLRAKTPDCGLIIDISGHGDLYFRVYVTNFVHSPAKGWV